MLELTLPKAKVRANINGDAPQTAKALAVFDQTSRWIVGRFKSTDMGIANGCICMERTAGALKALIGGDKNLTKEEVIELYKGRTWVYNTRTSLAEVCAIKFIEACVKTCAGIDFTF